MPIGFEQPDSGSASPQEETPPGGGRWPAGPEGDKQDRWAWADAVAGLIIPVAWTRWATREDERVCPECGPLDGLVWEEIAGPSPPLHVNCRCERVYAYTTWRVRD